MNHLLSLLKYEDYEELYNYTMEPRNRIFIKILHDKYHNKFKSFIKFVNKYGDLDLVKFLKGLDKDLELEINVVNRHIKEILKYFIEINDLDNIAKYINDYDVVDTLITYDIDPLPLFSAFLNFIKKHDISSLIIASNHFLDTSIKLNPNNYKGKQQIIAKRLKKWLLNNSVIDYKSNSCVIRDNELHTLCNPLQVCYKNACYNKNILGAQGSNSEVSRIFIKKGGKIVPIIVKKMSTEHAANRFNNPLNEINNYILASKKGIVPRFLDYYEYEINGNTYYLLFLEDLIYRGYKTLGSIYEIKEYRQAIIKLEEILGRLTSLGISHNDLHSRNIFWNNKKKDIKLIDFGAARPILKHNPRKQPIIFD